MKSTTLYFVSAIVGAKAIPSCLMGVDVLDQTITVGGTHSQGCHANIWSGNDVSQTPDVYIEMSSCAAGTTAQAKWSGWNYDFKINSPPDEAGKFADNAVTVAREYVGAEVGLTQHYSHTSFGAANVAITNVSPLLCGRKGL